MAFKPLTKEQYNSAIQAGFSHQQIIDMEKKRKAQNIEQPPGYFTRLAQDYSKAGQDIVSGIKEGATQMEKGDILGGIKTAGLRTVGGVASVTYSPITEAPIVKPALEGAANLISKVPGVDVIIQKAAELAQQHPTLAKDFQNIIDIATVGVGSGAQKPIGVALEKTGVALERSGMKAIDIAKQKFAQELVMPIETKAVKLAQVPRTTEAGGFFKKDIVSPTSMEVKSAEEVAKIPGISQKNTYQKNFNLIRDYNIKQAQQLESDLAKYDFVIPKKEVISKLDAAATSLQANPLIVGDAEKMANKLIEGAKKFVNENEGKGSGLLKARKQYDSWVLNQKPKAFDAKAENAFTIANREVRNTLNTILDENATNLGIKDSLASQSSLYRAMENVGPKAAQEANTPLLRAFDRIGKILNTKSRIVQAIAALVGIGGLGAASTFAPPVAIIGTTGFIIYKAGKLVMKPEVKIAVGKMLQQAGNLIAPADRKIFEDAIKNYSSE